METVVIALEPAVVAMEAVVVVVVRAEGGFDVTADEDFGSTVFIDDTADTTDVAHTGTTVFPDDTADATDTTEGGRLDDDA